MSLVSLSAADGNEDCVGQAGQRDGALCSVVHLILQDVQCSGQKLSTIVRIFGKPQYLERILFYSLMNSSYKYNLTFEKERQKNNYTINLDRRLFLPHFSTTQC